MRGASTGSRSGLRAAVLAAAMEMSRRGLSPGRSGNVSARTAEGMLITPSGLAYDTLRPGDMVPVRDDGNVSSGRLKPSSEWQLHLEAYRARPDIGAIVHSHSMHAVVLACAHRPIPAFHYMVAVAGGDDIPLVPYATFGTEELARLAANGLRHRNACLLANHGQIAVAGTPAEALELAAEVETLAEQFCKVLAIGEPKILSTDEMAEVLRRFKRYGQAAQQPPQG